jgi:hypothetical protein
VTLAKFQVELYGRAFGLGPEAFAVIPNGSDFPEGPGDDPVQTERDLVVSIGPLEKYKGHHRVIGALPALLSVRPHARVLILGSGPRLTVWGGDYPTPDGIGIRDFIHVSDLAEGPLSVLPPDAPGRVHGQSRHRRGQQCPGSDPDVRGGKRQDDSLRDRRTAHGRRCRLLRRSDLAEESMGWKATRSLTQMCADHWRWQSKNPGGYLAPGVPPPPIARPAPTGGYAPDHAANG